MDQIVYMIYRTRKTIYNLNFSNQFTEILEEFLHLEPIKNPLFNSTNPLLVVYLCYFVLTKLSNRVGALNNNMRKIAKKFMGLTLSMFKSFQQHSLKVYVTMPNQKGKILLDYMIKRFSYSFFQIRYFQNALKQTWKLSHRPDSVLSYFPNTKKIPTIFLFKGRIHKSHFQFHNPANTMSEFGFLHYNNSLNFKIVNQIVNALLLILYESFYITYFQKCLESRFATDERMFYHYRADYPELFYIGMVLKASVVLDSLMKIVCFNFKELPKILMLYIVKVLVIVIQTVVLLSLPTSTVIENYFITSNAKYLIIYVEIVEVLTYMMFIMGIGNYLTMFAQACLLILWLALISIICFMALSFLMSQVFIGYNSQFNVFLNLYNCMMRVYEYTFGAVVYTNETSAYAVLMNVFLILISFIGNLMLVNILIILLNNSFNRILARSRFITLKAKYKLNKMLENNNMNFLFLIPFNMTLFFLPLLPWVAFKRFSKPVSKAVKVITHIITVVFPLLIVLLLLDVYMILVRYLYMFKKIYKAKFISLKIVLRRFFQWLFIGLPAILVLTLIDNYNALRVICNYQEIREDNNKTQRLLPEEEQETKLRIMEQILEKLRGLRKEFKENMPKNKFIFEIFEELEEEDSESIDIESHSSTSDSQESFDSKLLKDKLRINIYDRLVKGFSRASDENINALFMEQYIQKHLKLETVDYILSYDFEEFEDAWKTQVMQEEKDYQNTVDKIEQNVNRVTNLLKFNPKKEKEKKCDCELCD